MLFSSILFDGKKNDKNLNSFPNYDDFLVFLLFYDVVLIEKLGFSLPP